MVNVAFIVRLLNVFWPAPDSVEVPLNIVAPVDTNEPVPTKLPAPLVTVEVAPAVIEAPAFIVNIPVIVKAELAIRLAPVVVLNVRALTVVEEGSANVVTEVPPSVSVPAVRLIVPLLIKLVPLFTIATVPVLFNVPLTVSPPPIAIVKSAPAPAFIVNVIEGSTVTEPVALIVA